MAGHDGPAVFYTLENSFMGITHYTPEDPINMANELHLDMHDSALPHILARHIDESI
ncbi:hypothetical protein KKJ01_19005 [Xenorhabdus bovienii]|uniref:Uncharacterized protein n=1 Tax=Xenorhabdus bovienii TaxID=40576 RepID=A0AAJ1JCU6_XENBV|nr:hypothetical protein [Xenorhabdus bovienii]